MAILRGRGLQLVVPAGWDGRITRGAADHDDEQSMAVVQAASFPIPGDVGDFGGGAVELMTARDIFVSLVEFGPESVGTPLFAQRGRRPLRTAMFDPNTLQRTLAGQSGIQQFFTERGRAFCLYVVLGSHLRRFGLVPEAQQAVDGLTVD